MNSTTATTTPNLSSTLIEPELVLPEETPSLSAYDATLLTARRSRATQRGGAVRNRRAGRSPLPATPTEATTKRCWICLGEEGEGGGQIWVRACGCSLISHERCLLNWIEETQKGQMLKKVLPIVMMGNNARKSRSFVPSVKEFINWRRTNRGS